MAAIDLSSLANRALAVIGRALGLVGGVAGTAHAVDLPPDHAEAMLQVYDGGGVRAAGPAVLIR